MDGWELAGFPGRLDIAAYLTVEQAAQYRVIVDALLDAQEHSLTGVGRDELLSRVRDRIEHETDKSTADRLTHPDVLDLDSRMKALHNWGVVIRWQDKATTEADFVRTRDRYQLTSDAADLHRWLRRRVDEDAVATSAAAFAPAVIADRLDDMLGALADHDSNRAARAWAQVRTTLKDMAEAAAIWQSRLASALAGAPDQDKMRRLRETLMAYVNVWGAGVDTYSPRIRTATARLRDITDDEWRVLTLAGLDADVAEETVQALVEAYRDSAETLHIWFRARGGQAQRLRRQVRDTVTPLLRGSRALLATGGRVTRRAELLRIATAVERAPSDEEAWRLWCAATGLWSARHLPGMPAEPSAPARPSFWAAPAVPIDVTLRKKGAQSVKGRPAQLPDRREARRAARRSAEQGRWRSEAAERVVLARSGAHVAEWPPVETAEEAAIIWELVGAVLRCRPDDTGVRLTYSRDGRWEVRAFPAPPARPSAVIATPVGRLACENWRFELTRT